MVGAAILLVVIFLAIGFGVSASNDAVAGRAELEKERSRSPRRESLLGNYSKAAVAADGGAICAQIGR